MTTPRTRASLVRWTAGAVIALVATGAVVVTARYVTAPVERLRGTFAYRPAGAAEVREAGLAAPGTVALDDVPETLLVALVFNEDKRFFEHGGFDLTEMRISIGEWMAGRRRLRGASTITQQLARTLFHDPGWSLRRKVLEAIDTVKLERTFTKDELLALYVSNVEWGPGVRGVTAAAAHYFQRRPAELESMDCVFLAAILPSPRRLAGVRERWQLPRGAHARMQRLLAGVRAAIDAERASGGTSRDPAVRAVSAVRAARARAAEHRRAAR